MRRISVRTLWAAGVVFAFALASASAQAADPAHKYVGAAKCKSCHNKELMGDQWGEWEKGVHHKAYETLMSDDAIEIAKKKGLATPPHETDDCLECHVTAYGMPAAAFDKKPIPVTEGIGCESCHGPGKDYRKKKTMSDRDKSVAAGMWEPENDAKICTACHNDRSPTWDAAKGFDHEAMMEKIAHPIPEDVKGRYLEVVAERKKAGISDDADEEEED